MAVQYLKSHHRRPIYFGMRFPMGDRQADIPAGWCQTCGREVFSEKEGFCPWCQVRKGVQNEI